MTAPFIMIVDDEVPFVETVVKRLEKRNIKTLASFSGEEGLEKLKAHQTSKSLFWISRCQAWTVSRR